MISKRFNMRDYRIANNLSMSAYLKNIVKEGVLRCTFIFSYRYDNKSKSAKLAFKIRYGNVNYLKIYKKRFVVYITINHRNHNASRV